MRGKIAVIMFVVAAGIPPLAATSIYANDVGMVAPFLSTGCPSGWLPLNSNSYYTNATAPQLAAAIADNTGGRTWGRTSFGTFSLPNLDGLFIRQTGGNAAGYGLIQTDLFKSHTHIQDAHSHSINAWLGSFGGGPTPIPANFMSNSLHNTNATTATNQNTGGIETRPVNISLINCVKAQETITQGADPMIYVSSISTSAIQQLQDIIPTSTPLTMSQGAFEIFLALAVCAGIFMALR